MFLTKVTNGGSMWEDFHDVENMWADIFRPSQITGLSADFTETNDAIVAEADLPGIKLENINVDTNSGYLTIKASRELAKGSQRWSGAVSKSFKLRSDLDIDNIKAEYKNGVLIVTIPKKPESKPKSIKVIG